jgi:hypothetical protein
MEHGALSDGDIQRTTRVSLRNALKFLYFTPELRLYWNVIPLIIFTIWIGALGFACLLCAGSKRRETAELDADPEKMPDTACTAASISPPLIGFEQDRGIAIS